MATNVLAAATLALGIIAILIAPGMPLWYQPHNVEHFVVGGLTAAVGAVGLAMSMKKK